MTNAPLSSIYAVSKSGWVGIIRSKAVIDADEHESSIFGISTYQHIIFFDSSEDQSTTMEVADYGLVELLIGWRIDSESHAGRSRLVGDRNGLIGRGQPIFLRHVEQVMSVLLQEIFIGGAKQ